MASGSGLVGGRGGDLGGGRESGDQEAGIWGLGTHPHQDEGGAKWGGASGWDWEGLGLMMTNDWEGSL